MTKQIVFLDRETIAPQTILRRPNFAHSWVEHGRTSPEQVLERLANGTNIVITNKVSLRADALAKLPSLELIAVAATGTDVVDIGYRREHGITVSISRLRDQHGPGAHLRDDLRTTAQSDRLPRGR